MDKTSILQNLTSLSGFERGKVATNEDLAGIEVKLSVKLPEPYKIFLKMFGYATWISDSIFGVSDESIYSVVHKTMEVKNTAFPDSFVPIPKDAIIISEYGGGGSLLLYTESSARAGQVSLVLDETFYEEEDCWPDFYAFVSDWCL